jgi:hypothetical protein
MRAVYGPCVWGILIGGGDIAGISRQCLIKVWPIREGQIMANFNVISRQLDLTSIQLSPPASAVIRWIEYEILLMLI